MHNFFLIFIGLLLLAVYSTYKQLNTWDRTEEVTPVDVERAKTQSPIERRLLYALRNNGYYPRTQVSCGKYSIDIAFPVQRIAIECDGKAYHSTPQQKAHDKRKDRFLRKHGWKVLRFTGRKINQDVKSCVNRIETELRKRQWN